MRELRLTKSRPGTDYGDAVESAARSAARLVVIDALALEGGSVHRAARRLGVTDATVYRLVDGLGLAGELDRIRSETPGAVRGRPPESRVGR